jgi:hypothetical protein
MSILKAFLTSSVSLLVMFIGILRGQVVASGPCMNGSITLVLIRVGLEVGMVEMIRDLY